EDHVAVKTHASPAFHAIQYLLGRLPKERLARFRQTAQVDADVKLADLVDRFPADAQGDAEALRDALKAIEYGMNISEVFVQSLKDKTPVN
ncbi:MAG: hypothetical protein IH946_09550, partial [Bacteroidetes bacterium]|nr:hypothetical protein [Bacteroidota bacterium]